MIKRVNATLLVASMCLISSTAAWAQATGWKPDRPVEFIVGAGAGAAADTTARILQRIMQDHKLVPVQVSVLNKPGAGNSIGWSYVNAHPGNGHYLAVTSLPLITNAITGLHPLNYADVTPIVQLFSEYVVHMVRADSPLKSGREMADRLRQNPGALSIALAAALGTQNHIATGLAMKAAGVDVRKLKIVVFDSSRGSLTALLGGHVDIVAATVSNVLAHLKAGSVRVIAVSSPKRLGGEMAAVPTWKEQGIDIVSDNWRGIIGPKSMSPAQIGFWEEVFARTTDSDDWKRELEKNFLTPGFLRSDASRKFLSAEQIQLKALLTDLGLAKN